MSRVIFWTLLVILVVAAVRSKLRGSGFFGGFHSSGSSPAAPKPAGEIESMTECAHCHLHFPVSEAVRADGRDYCSSAHVRLPPL